ncbi:tetratricopeptide repeat protein [Nitrospina gracilis]|uniref:tetratricopeptide repeat protein n=1 Tax=Nitrospina gracilis TaxID=35801 RepID=UPI001F40D8DC|nr:tetratricopeptide repeat protein [Nitrospina gracilis]MCF8720307.1 tetratricopeptide (TPR) repeat protein [Nitrospina gracilis Nb-211]
MNDIERLLNDLKKVDSKIRKQATQSLWMRWYQECGEAAERRLYEGIRLMDAGELARARFHFADLVEQFPEFTEAHNKLATVHYLEGNYEEAIAECRIVVEKAPHHFGAWNGMGMCLFHLGRLNEAIHSFQKALEIQPYAEDNRHYIGLCRGKLN